MASPQWQWNLRQHAWTCGLEVERSGWLRGVRASWGVPRLGKPYGAAEVASIDGGPTVNGTVMLIRQPFDGEPETLLEYEIDSPYTYAGIQREWVGEQEYGTVYRYRLVVERAEFLYLEMEEGGCTSRRTNFAVGPIEDVVEYRQVEDTQSWGSEHQKALVIPFQDVR